jgi:hypothetical protein
MEHLDYYYALDYFADMLEIIVKWLQVSFSECNR